MHQPWALAPLQEQIFKSVELLGVEARMGLCGEMFRGLAIQFHPVETEDRPQSRNGATSPIIAEA